MIVKECRYEPPHQHRWPDDWTFGGANGEDPRADPRWTPTTYLYLDDHFNVVWTTQVPLCDDQAIEEFTKHADIGAKYLQVKRPGLDAELLDWEYDARSDTASLLGG